MEITAQSPYFSRLNLWSKERFPIFNFSTAIFMYLLPKMFMLVKHQEAFHWSIFDLCAVVFVAANLFILRVLDEYKDYQSDLINNPHRVLQRGIVSLKELRILGFAALILEFAAFVGMKPDLITVGAFVFLNIWIFLMFKEFFVKDWLRQQLFLYSFLHLLVSPLITLVLILALDPAAAVMDFVLLMGLGFSVGWVYEISRKTKSREEETQDLTFSKVWGYPVSLFVIFFVSALSLALTFEVGLQMQIQSLFFKALLTVVLLLQGLQLFSFLKKPSVKERKKNEGMAALIGAIGYVVPVLWVWLQNR